jgi:hypothetical protein
MFAIFHLQSPIFNLQSPISNLQSPRQNHFRIWNEPMVRRLCSLCHFNIEPCFAAGIGSTIQKASLFCNLPPLRTANRQSIQMFAEGMNVHPPSWELKSQRCSVCDAGELVFSRCPACATVVLICAECTAVFSIQDKRPDAEIGNMSGAARCCHSCGGPDHGEFPFATAQEIQALGLLPENIDKADQRTMYFSGRADCVSVCNRMSLAARH